VLSNEFGRAPLVIDEATVSDGHAGTVLPLLHQGGTRWEIPAGRTATSDPVPLSTTAGDELVVSCFVAGSTDVTTFLHSAQRTGEVAPGNQLGEPRLTDPEQFTSLHWIARVLTDGPVTGPVIVAFGDSITRGDGTTADRDQRYPDHLQRRLLAAGVEGAAVLNAGLGGNRLLGSPVGPSMIDRFERDVRTVAEATHVVIMGGVNDIAVGAMLGRQRPTANEIIDGLFALAHRAQENGIRPALGTLTPILAGSFEWFRADGNEEIRRTVNDALTTQKHWPVVDFATRLAAPDDPTRLAAAFDSGDGVHPGDAGARALADAIDLDIFLQ
jgi:lysophospholipase L1-like esterase